MGDQKAAKHEDLPEHQQRRLFGSGTPFLGYAGAMAVLVLMVAFGMTAPSLNAPTSSKSTPRHVTPN